MGSSVRDLTDQRFHSLVAVCAVGRDKQNRVKWLCLCDCGATRIVASRHLLQGRTKTCGCRIGLTLPKPALGLKGPLHPRWKGGRYIVNGYVYLIIDGRSIAQHRVVMEQHLGRALDDDEIVHHKNEIRDDNRVENLEVMSRSAHAILHGLGTTTRG